MKTQSTDAVLSRPYDSDRISRKEIKSVSKVKSKFNELCILESTQPIVTHFCTQIELQNMSLVIKLDYYFCSESKVLIGPNFKFSKPHKSPVSFLKVKTILTFVTFNRNKSSQQFLRITIK